MRSSAASYSPTMISWYYSKVFMCTHRYFIQNRRCGRVGRKRFLSQYVAQTTNGGSPLSWKSQNTPLLGTFSWPLHPTCCYPAASLFSPCSSRLSPETPNSSHFSCKFTSKVSGTNFLSLLARQRRLRVRNHPPEEAVWVLKNIVFPSPLQ